MHTTLGNTSVLCICFKGIIQKQAEKLKSRKMKEGWMKIDEEWWRVMESDEGWMKDEEWMMEDDDFKMLRGFDYGQNYGHLWM